MQPAVVVHLNVERAARRKAVAPKLQHEQDQARLLAPWVHLADVRLGRCADVPWHDLPLAERDAKIERAAIAVRLGDPLIIAAAEEHAAGHVHARTGGADVPQSRTVRELVAGAVRTALSHLGGNIGGRR